MITLSTISITVIDAVSAANARPDAAANVTMKDHERDDCLGRRQEYDRHHGVDENEPFPSWEIP